MTSIVHCTLSRSMRTSFHWWLRILPTRLCMSPLGRGVIRMFREVQRYPQVQCSICMKLYRDFLMNLMTCGQLFWNVSTCYVEFLLQRRMVDTNGTRHQRRHVQIADIISYATNQVLDVLRLISWTVDTRSTSLDKKNNEKHVVSICKHL